MRDFLEVISVVGLTGISLYTLPIMLKAFKMNTEVKNKVTILVGAVLISYVAIFYLILPLGRWLSAFLAYIFYLVGLHLFNLKSRQT